VELFAWEPAATADTPFAELRGLPYPALVPAPGQEPFASLPLRTVSAKEGGYVVVYGNPLGGALARVWGNGGRDAFDRLSGDFESCDPLAPYCAGAGLNGGPPASEIFRGLHVGLWEAVARHGACCDGNHWTLAWFDQARGATYGFDASYDTADLYGGTPAPSNLAGAQALAAVAEGLVPAE
jgi:hypothetical protein